MTKREQEQSDDRIREQDVAPPYEPGVNPADDDQHEHALEVLPPPGDAVRGGALHLQCEAQSEQQRKYRYEFYVHQPLDHWHRDGVEA